MIKPIIYSYHQKKTKNKEHAETFIFIMPIAECQPYPSRRKKNKLPRFFLNIFAACHIPYSTSLLSKRTFSGLEIVCKSSSLFRFNQGILFS